MSPRHTQWESTCSWQHKNGPVAVSDQDQQWGTLCLWQGKDPTPDDAGAPGSRSASRLHRQEARGVPDGLLVVALPPLDSLLLKIAPWSREAERCDPWKGKNEEIPIKEADIICITEGSVHIQISSASHPQLHPGWVKGLWWLLTCESKASSSGKASVCALHDNVSSATRVRHEVVPMSVPTTNVVTRPVVSSAVSYQDMQSREPDGVKLLKP